MKMTKYLLTCISNNTPMAVQDLSREEKETLYQKLAATQPGAELKGDTMPYTSLNGHMYSYLAKDNSLGLRLPKEEREEGDEMPDAVPEA